MSKSRHVKCTYRMNNKFANYEFFEVTEWYNGEGVAIKFGHDGPTIDLTWGEAEKLSELLNEEFLTDNE